MNSIRTFLTSDIGIALDFIFLILAIINFVVAGIKKASNIRNKSLKDGRYLGKVIFIYYTIIGVLIPSVIIFFTWNSRHTILWWIMIVLAVYLVFSFIMFCRLILNALASVRNDQLKQREKDLIDKMKYHLNHVFVTNHSKPEEPIEAQELDKHFKEYDRAMKLRAMAVVFKVSIEEVEAMLAVKLPDYISNNMDVFKITKY